MHWFSFDPRRLFQSVVQSSGYVGFSTVATEALRFSWEAVRVNEDDSYGTGAAILVAIIWGLSFVAAHVVLSTLTPVLLATVRFSIASLIFTPVIFKELMHRRIPELRDLLEFTLLGFLGVSLYFVLQYTGVMYAGAGISALLVVGFIPILTGITSMIVLNERFEARRVLGVVLGLSGLFLIVMPKLFLGELDRFFYLGVVCLLLDAVCWALYSTLSRRIMIRMNKPSLVTAYVTVLGTLALLPLSITSDWGLVFVLQSDQWLGILFLSIACSGLGYFLWNFALSRLETVRAAVWLYLEPVAAFVGESLVLGVTPAPMTLLGGVAIVAGSIMTSRAHKR